MGKKIRMTLGLILMLSSIFVLMNGILEGRFKPVTIIVGENEIKWKSTMNTVSSCLNELGIDVSSKDKVIPSLEASLVSGMLITVERHFDITIEDGGAKDIYTVSAKTVGGALEQLEIELGERDLVSPSLDSILTPESHITITRREYISQTELEKIPYTTWEFLDNRIDEGKTQVWRVGEKGVKEKTYLIYKENGTVLEKILMEEKVIEEPKIHVVARGTKPLYYTLKTPTGPVLYTKKMTIEATAYYPGPESTGKFADGYTAIGLRAGHGIIAVDPKVIPLRTRVYIPNYGFAIAGDVGGAIKGNIIDLCFETYREAIQFGRRKVDLYILADQGR